jgi:linoleoyl-CoA desaturase
MDTTRSESFDNSSRTTVSTDSEGNSSPVEQQKAPEDHESNDGVDYAAFGKEIQAVRRRIQQKMGQEDIDYIRDVIKTSRSLEVIGRGLLHAGKGPLSFLGGTLSLWVHKQLEAMEIGHTVLHGAYNNFENNEGLDSDDFYWRVPIHEESWKHGHNVMHHRHTNIAGKDPDLEFGVIRLDDKIKWRPAHALQLPLTLFMVFPNFTFWMNWHFTGLTDVYLNKDRLDVLDELNWESIKEAHKKTLESYAKHYGYEYVLWPLLAGWKAPRVLAGNMLTEVLRDVYAAATIFCGHIGEETATYETDESARGRGQWYAMQVESANNFKVPKPISIMCGALDLQIEHHLFPEFPPNRLREIQPEIQEICERHGVEYRMDTWPKTLWGAFKKIARLSKESGGNPFRATSAVAADMT